MTADAYVAAVAGDAGCVAGDVAAVVAGAAYSM